MGGWVGGWVRVSRDVGGWVGGWVEGVGAYTLEVEGGEQQGPVRRALHLVVAKEDVDAEGEEGLVDDVSFFFFVVPCGVEWSGVGGWRRSSFPPIHSCMHAPPPVPGDVLKGSKAQPQATGVAAGSSAARRKRECRTGCQGIGGGGVGGWVRWRGEGR